MHTLSPEMDESQAMSMNGNPAFRTSQKLKCKAIRSKKKLRGVEFFRQKL